jgi:hypothetical protein
LRPSFQEEKGVISKKVPKGFMTKRSIPFVTLDKVLDQLFLTSQIDIEEKLPFPLRREFRRKPWLAFQWKKPTSAFPFPHFIP